MLVATYRSEGISTEFCVQSTSHQNFMCEGEEYLVLAVTLALAKGSQREGMHRRHMIAINMEFQLSWPKPALKS